MSGRAWAVAALVIALSLAVAGVARADEIIERVLAVAGGDVITLSDVSAVRELHLWTPPGSSEPLSADTRAIVDALINRALMLAEVDRYAPPEPDAEAVDRDMRAVTARFPDPAALAAALDRVGLDESHLREFVRQNLRIRGYIDERFAVPGEQQRQLVADWVAGLRRRATISELDPNAR